VLVVQLSSDSGLLVLKVSAHLGEACLLLAQPFHRQVRVGGKRFNQPLQLPVILRQLALNLC
jgi:hypothetical protein